MELIILFVLYMIVSSIMRAIGNQRNRGRQATTGPQTPPPVAPPPMGPFDYSASEEIEEASKKPQRPVTTPKSLPGGIVGAEDTTSYRARKGKNRKTGSLDSSPREVEKLKKPVARDEIGSTEKCPKPKNQLGHV